MSKPCCMMKCSVENCNNIMYARLLCRRHYNDFNKNGKLEKMPYMFDIDLIEYFFNIKLDNFNLKEEIYAK